MKTALITGASRGIGRGIALFLAQNSYNIVLNYKEQTQAASEVEDKIIGFGARCLTVRCDVSKLDEVQSMHKKVKSIFGGVDILINNAGVARGGLIQDVSQGDYDYIMDTNLRGVFNTSKVFIPDMISNKWGRIVNISSIWGLVGGSGEAVYSASKAAVIGLTKALAQELAPSNITVNCIAPGAIQTDMLNQLPKAVLDSLQNEIPAGRLGSPSDIASLTAYLVSQQASYLTGQIINASGGFTIV